MVTRTARLLLIIVGVAATVTLMLPASAGGPILPKVPNKFERIGDWSTHSIDVDKSTVQVEMQDGEPLMTAVFRIVSKTPMEFKPGVTASSWINKVTAVCGYDGLVLVESKAYNEQGKLISTLDQPLPLRDFKQESTPPSEAYKFLCGKYPSQAPTPGRNKSTASYT